MQTLNVGAGRTDEEYKAAEEQRLADLRTESKSAAEFFFVAAGLAALGTGLLPVRVNIFVNIGVVDLLTIYGGSLVRVYPGLPYVAAVVWLLVVAGLGFAAPFNHPGRGSIRKGHSWAFLAGIVLYALDMIILIPLFSLWAFGVHAFFVYKWFQGQRNLREIKHAMIGR